MRRFMLILVYAAFCGLPGCSLVQRFHAYQQKGIDEYVDDYKIVGDDGRGEMPREKETDWLTPFTESPQARAINHNLGYD